MSEDSFAYKAAEAAYKADDEYPFSPSGLLDACRAYHGAMLQFVDDAHFGYAAFLMHLEAKNPEAWERGYKAGYLGEPHKMNNIQEPAYQAGWLAGNGSRMVLPQGDESVTSTVIPVGTTARYKRARVTYGTFKVE